jgi:hypothetical protein
MVVDDDINLLRLYEARISHWPMSPQVIGPAVRPRCRSP